MAMILSELVVTHRTKFFFILNITRSIVCKKVIRKLIPDKYYTSLSSHIIFFERVSSLQISTHLVTKYAELEDDDIKGIDSENEGAYYRRKHL